MGITMANKSMKMTIDAWLILAVLIVQGMPGIALGQGIAPTREQTRDADLNGPTVDWTGTIAEILQDGDDTCFVLQSTTDGLGYQAAARTSFMACGFGPFDPATFSLGREVAVRGNLGAAMPRRTGGRIYDYPVVVAASIKLAPVRLRDDWHHPYYGLYGCDPFWHPWPSYYHCWP